MSVDFTPSLRSRVGDSGGGVMVVSKKFIYLGKERVISLS